MNIKKSISCVRGLAGVTLAGLALLLASCQPAAEKAPQGRTDADKPARTVLRVGHFPNITHAQALVAHHLTRQGKGWFEERLGVEIEWLLFNAGPSATEAMFAGNLDLTYIGPNPAINAYMRSRGEEVRVVAGALEGGAALVVRGDAAIREPADFKGLKLATPQFGNTQDVAARAWLMRHGMKVTMTGGDVSILPTANPDQLALFQRGELDAVWTVEPWVSRLEMEAGGRVFLEQTDAVTTLLIARAAVVREEPDLIRRFRLAHAELTAWMLAHPEEAKAMVRAELAEETGRPVPEELVARAWGRLILVDRLEMSALESFVQQAREIGFIKEVIGLERMQEGIK